MNINYFKFEENRKKDTEKVVKRKQEFIGVRREERERVLGELLERIKNHQKQIKIEELEKIINELLEKDYEKPRRFC